MASSITYAPFGPHTAITFGNGLADARTFDTRYRLGTWTTGALISKTYAWQDDDNITGITDNLNSANNRAFGYDEIHRLTAASGPWGAGSYSYDANGNRLTKTEGASSTSYTYTAGTNRLATATGSEPGTYTCDSNGNTTGDGTHTYQYSQRDRLAIGRQRHDRDLRLRRGRAKRPEDRRWRHHALFLRPDGKLLEEYIPATAAGKDYVWLPGTYEPLARVDFGLADTDNGDVLRCTKSSSNVHLDWSLDSASGPFVVSAPPRSPSAVLSTWGQPKARRPSMTACSATPPPTAYEAFRRTLTDTLYFYHADHLGTPIAMTNGAGAFVWRAEHTPFGGIYSMPVATIENNLRFPGQYWDAETGLAQNGDRDNDHAAARYREPDPLPIKGMPNLYPYAQNSPIVVFDEDGRQAGMVVGVIVVGGIIIGLPALIDYLEGQQNARKACECVPCHGYAPTGLGLMAAHKVQTTMRAPYHKEPPKESPYICLPRPEPPHDHTEPMELRDPSNTPSWPPEPLVRPCPGK